MDDELMMSMGYSLAHKEEQYQLLPQLHLLAVFIDRNPIDIFHDEIRPAILCVPCVNQMGDRRMVQVCEKLAFLEKSVAPGGALDVGPKALDRDVLLQLSVGSFGKVHRAHAAGTQNSNTPIGPPTH